MPKITSLGTLSSGGFGKSGKMNSNFPNSFSLIGSYYANGSQSTGSVQTFTPTATAIYQFIATGATASNTNESARWCGRPAVIKSTLSLSAQQQVSIVVGQQGWLGDARPGWGGGGGSFVWISSNNFLICAAGGCGAPHTAADGWSSYQDASLTTSGQPGSTNQSTFATNGSGGGGYAGGGAGWLANGTSLQSSSFPTIHGKSLSSGFTGGDRGGGYGGGGGCSNTWGGAGGGYSGGYSGTSGAPYAGGGGGSYVCSSMQNDLGTAIYTSKQLSGLNGYTMSHGSVLVYIGN